MPSFDVGSLLLAIRLALLNVKLKQPQDLSSGTVNGDSQGESSYFLLPIPEKLMSE
jgi:hypothetical protein